MARNWDRISRQGLDIAIAATSIGFHAAKFGTRVGFSVARGICTTAASATTVAVDLTFFGGTAVTNSVVPGAVSAALSIAERITLGPIHLGEYITNTSLLAAHSSINVLAAFFPGSSEASFSLASFILLVRREWRDPPQLGNMPAREYGLTQVARAIVAWVALQGVTQEMQEKRWFRHLKELDLKYSREPTLRHKTSRVRVTSDTIFPGHGGPQIITADIGESWPRGLRLRRTRSRLSMRQSSVSSLIDIMEEEPTIPIAELKATLRRFSKMVLAGYGGASLLFFGIEPLQALGNDKSVEEAKLANAVDAAEAEAAGEATDSTTPGPAAYSWWDILLGKHDQEIFENSIHGHNHSRLSNLNLKNQMKARAVVGDEHLMPRFWVLTDYSRGEVVVVLRGTMSLNEIAVDLTCEPEWFTPASTPPLDHDEMHLPGRFVFPSVTSSSLGSKARKRAASVDSTTRYSVHGGMLKMAKLMGDIGKPVQLAVMEALHYNPDFDLVLCGHSLGAGVAALLGMIWADPRTCLTVPSSGLPVGRRVQVYCFAPPALTDATLSRLARNLIVSFVYSHDVVSRLSLGTIRDIRNAASWLCEAESEAERGSEGGTSSAFGAKGVLGSIGEFAGFGSGEGTGGEGYSAVTARARAWQTRETDGRAYEDVSEMDWFVATRKTLEASMQSVDMYPPGRVLWAVRDGDLHVSNRRWEGNGNGTDQSRQDGKKRNGNGINQGKKEGKGRNEASTTAAQDAEQEARSKLRLFDVLDVEQVFSQIVFAKDMLTAHMPHQYDMALHELL